MLVLLFVARAIVGKIVSTIHVTKSFFIKHKAIDMKWFDGHIDLAFLAERGRDVLKPIGVCGGPFQPASVSIHSLVNSSVFGFLGTLFAEPISKGLASQEELHSVRESSLRQLRFYQKLAEDGFLSMIGQNSAGIGKGLRCGISIENPECIRGAEELAWWREQGVLSIGLAWNFQTRFAGGTKTDHGLSTLGRELVSAARAVGVLVDVSHLNDKSLEDLFILDNQTLIASHSNVRELLSDTTGTSGQRHLADWAIMEIAKRGGVIGLNLYQHAIKSPHTSRASISDLVRHAEYISSLTGRTDVIGIGSDMDGGISANELCDPIRSHNDLDLISIELSRIGWTDAEISGVQKNNWLRALSLPLIE